MKEQFIVAQIMANRLSSTHYDDFILVNPNGKDTPPIFDTYKEAENWIKENGVKAKWYQIQKFIMPI